MMSEDNALPNDPENPAPVAVDAPEPSPSAAPATNANAAATTTTNNQKWKFVALAAFVVAAVVIAITLGVTLGKDDGTNKSTSRSTVKEDASDTPNSPSSSPSFGSAADGTSPTVTSSYTTQYLESNGPLLSKVSAIFYHTKGRVYLYHRYPYHHLFISPCCAFIFFSSFSKVRMINPSVANGYDSCDTLKDDITNALKHYANVVIVSEKSNNWYAKCDPSDPNWNLGEVGVIYEGYEEISEDVSISFDSPAPAGGSENNQVEGVDEADIVKSDDNYVYAGYGTYNANVYL
jgi:hypothetical protein